MLLQSRLYDDPDCIHPLLFNGLLDGACILTDRGSLLVQYPMAYSYDNNDCSGAPIDTLTFPQEDVCLDNNYYEIEKYSRFMQVMGNTVIA
jgi:hypothetical protein